MNAHKTLKSLFTDIANAIRSKTGGTDSILADDFPTAILNIETGGGGITPTGTISITENGTHDVTEYANANVNVEAVKKSEVIHFTLASDLTAGTHTLVSGNDFIKNHRADESLVCMLRADTPATGVKNVSMVLVTNNVMAGIGTANTGVAFASINGTSMSMFALVNLFTAEGYNQALYSDANGNLKITLGTNRVLVAGDYTVYLTIE